MTPCGESTHWRVARLPLKAAATQDPAAPRRSPRRLLRAAPVEETSADRDEGLAFIRGFLIAVLLVLPFWMAVSLMAYVLLF